jgi:hypothetical protein
MSTNALKRNNDPNEAHPKSSRSPKWMNLLKPIWSKYSRSSEHSHGNVRQRTGSSVQLIKEHAGQVGFSHATLASSQTDGVIAHKGLAPIILPSDPIALLDRLDLLLASHRCG